MAQAAAGAINHQQPACIAPRGRMLSAAAFAHLGLAAPPQAGVQMPLFGQTDDDA